MIAALYVETDGAYYGLEGVDPWDEARDARLYDGPHPVVAHPPCARWCKLSSLVESQGGARRGADGGCFAAALASVRRFGGVLEHPAYTAAWAAHDLPRPHAGNGWSRAFCGGWVCHLEQWAYGHPARKETWLYAHGLVPPPMRWDRAGTRAVMTLAGPNRARLVKAELPRAERSKTPPAFRGALIAMARSVPRD